MLHSLFTYGTLQIPEIMQAVSGVLPDSEPALLQDFVRLRLKRRIYPGVLPEHGNRVCGRLYHGIDNSTLDCLDAFEDSLYVRRQLEVVTTGAAVMAHVYLVADQHRHLLSADPWDIDRFKARYFYSYLESCRKFHDAIRANPQPGQ